MYYDIYLQGPSMNTIVHVPKKTNTHLSRAIAVIE